MTIPQHWIKQKINTKSSGGIVHLRVPDNIWTRMHQAEYNDVFWSAVMRDALVAAMDLIDDDKSKKISK